MPNNEKCFSLVISIYSLMTKQKSYMHAFKILIHKTRKIKKTIFLNKNVFVTSKTILLLTYWMIIRNTNKCTHNYNKFQYYLTCSS